VNYLRKQQASIIRISKHIATIGLSFYSFFLRSTALGLLDPV